jgi:hypothetical protein
METTEVGPLWELRAWAASLVRAGVDGICTGVLAGGFQLFGIGGAKLAYSSAPAVLRKPSEGSCRSVMNRDFIA